MKWNILDRQENSETHALFVIIEVGIGQYGLVVGNVFAQRNIDGMTAECLKVH